jgi:hypothetical protein
MPPKTTVNYNSQNFELKYEQFQKYLTDLNITQGIESIRDQYESEYFTTTDEPKQKYQEYFDSYLTKIQNLEKRIIDLTEELRQKTHDNLNNAMTIQELNKTIIELIEENKKIHKIVLINI